MCCPLSQIQLFLDVLMKEVLHPESQAPSGVKFHFVAIYLEELSRVGGKEVRSRHPLRPRAGPQHALPARAGVLGTCQPCGQRRLCPGHTAVLRQN